MNYNQQYPYPPNYPYMPHGPGFSPKPSSPGNKPQLRLAQAYVPWQHMDKVFSPAEGLACGTIFPELVFPYQC